MGMGRPSKPERPVDNPGAAAFCDLIAEPSGEFEPPKPIRALGRQVADMVTFRFEGSRRDFVRVKETPEFAEYVEAFVVRQIARVKPEALAHYRPGELMVTWPTATGKMGFVRWKLVRVSNPQTALDGV